MSDATLETSLLEHLDTTQLTCLNELHESGKTLKSIVASKTRNTTAAHLLSDVDEQLLLNISFNQSVRIRSIIIQTSAEHVSQAPRSIKLIINQPALDFDDVDGAEVAQELELSGDQVRAGRKVPLRYVRFQAVNSLHIFVASNQGGEDQTRIDAVDIFGQSVAGTRDLSGLRRQED